MFKRNSSDSNGVWVYWLSAAILEVMYNRDLSSIMYCASWMCCVQRLFEALSGELFQTSTNHHLLLLFSIYFISLTGYNKLCWGIKVLWLHSCLSGTDWETKLRTEVGMEPAVTLSRRSFFLHHAASGSRFALLSVCDSQMGFIVSRLKAAKNKASHHVVIALCFDVVYTICCI